jgi:hypothetical protein
VSVQRDPNRWAPASSERDYNLFRDL